MLQRWQGLGPDAESRPRFAPEGGPAWFEPIGWALRHQLSAREEGERLSRPIGPPLPEAQREAARWMNTYVRLDRTWWNCSFSVEPARAPVEHSSERDVIVAILKHLGLPSEPPPIARARSPSCEAA
ncbi:hypothetical protein [Sorangium sp. So ce1097]|uniref:hypothetical protein n=1 Tax=Sorangium sp. So ce1097 TaxID=3133330 RepID=UPI003F63D4A7